MDNTVIGIVVALLVVLVTVLLFLLRGGGKSRSNVLVCGISNAGKTTLFARLCSGGKLQQTYVSIKENQGTCSVGGDGVGRPVRLVDIPGNDRQRVNIFENYRSSARAIVFVVDSVAFIKELKDVAEYAYVVLSDPDCQRLRVLVACNKHDEGMAKSSQVIRGQLEKELQLLRKTQTSKLVTTEGAQLGRKLGKAHKDFAFDDLVQKVDFVEFSATEDLQPVADWLASL